MLFAEAVTFDPGVVVLIFLVFAAVVLTSLAVVVGGLVAGVRAAHDPTRTGAATVWGLCAAAEGLLLVTAVVSGWVEGTVALLAVLAVTVIARYLPAPRA